MAKIAIVYHSGYGHTAKQAQAVEKGAAGVDGAQVSLLTVDEAMNQWEILDNADAIIFGSPTYMGSISAALKAFMEASSRRWAAGAWKDKLAAGFTNSGSLSGDKLNSLMQIVVFACQHGMIWVSGGVVSEGRQDDDTNRLGSYTGAMAQSDQNGGQPTKGDLEAARLLGQRVAESAKRWNRS